MANLIIVHPSEVEVIKPIIEPMLKSIAEPTKGRMSLSDIYRFIAEKDILLWAAVNNTIDAVMLTEIRSYAGRKMLVILGATGKNMADWKDLMSSVEEYAKMSGCDGIEAIARKGWSRVLEGFEQSHVFIEKMFDNKN